MDEIQTDGGAYIGGDANAGKDVVGRDKRTRRNSPSANVQIGNQSDPLAPLWNEVMQVSIDLRFLTNRHAEDINKLTGSIDRLHRDMQDRELTTREYNRVTREMISTMERNISTMREHVDMLRTSRTLTKAQVDWLLLGVFCLIAIVAFGVWFF